MTAAAADDERGPQAAGDATMQAMAETHRPELATVTAPSAGALVLAVRERVGVDRERLARRAGVDETLVARIEAGEHAVDRELLATLLLVLGYQLEAEREGAAAAAPRRLDRYDAGHLADELATPMGERLERSLGWNAFAAELAAAGPPDAPRDEG